jgi:hypothetical protein
MAISIRVIVGIIGMFYAMIIVSSERFPVLYIYLRNIRVNLCCDLFSSSRMCSLYASLYSAIVHDYIQN